MGRDSKQTRASVGNCSGLETRASDYNSKLVASSRAAGGQPATSPQRPWAESSGRHRCRLGRSDESGGHSIRPGADERNFGIIPDWNVHAILRSEYPECLSQSDHVLDGSMTRSYGRNRAT
jgi:hypothetical protein